MNFVLILFNPRDEELNAEKTITVKNVSYCSYEKRAWKIFRLVWDLNRLPSAILGAALTSVESEAQELRNSFCFLVFVIVVVMVAYIKLRSIVKHHDRQVLSILSNDWFSWFLLKADHSWVLNYDIRWSANFFCIISDFCLHDRFFHIHLAGFGNR